jgi:putative DNA primase/helicase
VSAADIRKLLDGAKVLPLPTRHMERRTNEEDDGAQTEIVLAETFVASHAADWRYCTQWGRWLEWDGNRWKIDERMRHFDLSRQICKAASEAEENSKAQASIGRASTVAAVVRLASAMPEMATIAEQWDADPWLINMPGAEIDLRTGRIGANERNSYCTKLAGSAPGGDCPTWLRFLGEVCRGDEEVVRYLQRYVGYCLTGSTREHSVLFVWGPGGNGKSVFLNVLNALLGDYAITAPASTFTETRGEQHPTDMASLRGARLVTVSEVEEGRRWAESKIKALTGGDPITARFMRQDFFTYQPTFKLVIVANHQPRLRNVDEAMRRRLHFLPFVFKPVNPDRDLEAKLMVELPGIAQWALDGCLAWQQQGLQKPAVVERATEAYFAAEDIIGQWIEERAERDPNGFETSDRLFADWTDYATRAGAYVGPQRRLLSELEGRGFTPHRRRTSAGNRRGFMGIVLTGANP